MTYTYHQYFNHRILDLALLSLCFIQSKNQNFSQTPERKFQKSFCNGYNFLSETLLRENYTIETIIRQPLTEGKGEDVRVCLKEAGEHACVQICLFEEVQARNRSVI